MYFPHEYVIPELKSPALIFLYNSSKSCAYLFINSLSTKRQPCKGVWKKDSLEIKGIC